MFIKHFLLVLIPSVVFVSISFAQASFYMRLADSTMTLTKYAVRYDPAYVKINYPNGDVEASTGVCTDVVIRAYRKMGIDLQKEVHEDMKAHFELYPKGWGLMQPDKNIDHRRVPNLMTYFTRHGIPKPLDEDERIYLPGDIVCWNLGGNVKHIGIVVKKKSPDGKRHLVVHNIGAGQVEEDCLFKFKIIGHYRYQQ